VIQPTLNFATTTTIASLNLVTSAKLVGVIGQKEVHLEMFLLVEGVVEITRRTKEAVQNLLIQQTLMKNKLHHQVQSLLIMN
jgi:cytoskeletal protein CcmA (bactofilin family)